MRLERRRGTESLGYGWLRGRSPRRMGEGGLRGTTSSKPPTRSGRSLHQPFGPWVAKPILPLKSSDPLLFLSSSLFKKFLFY